MKKLLFTLLLLQADALTFKVGVTGGIVFLEKAKFHSVANAVSEPKISGNVNITVQGKKVSAEDIRSGAQIPGFSMKAAKATSF